MEGSAPILQQTKILHSAHKETFMRPLAFAAALGLTLAFSTTTLYAQDWQMPPDNQRCPSKWGADDQRGAGNLQTPASVLAALKLAKTGEIFELGAILSPNP